MFTPCLAPKDAFIQHILTIICSANQLLQAEYQTYCAADATFKIQHKDDLSPVTQADLKCNDFILHALQQITPEIAVLSEEGDVHLRHTWQKCWLLDPLDGTKEFLKKRPEFTINLSLIEQGETLFSVIAVPAQRIVYLGYTDQLPYKYLQDQNTWQQYQAQPPLESNCLKLGLSHRSRQIEYQQFTELLAQHHSIESITAGSAYKFCLMLEGEIDLYPRFHPTCEWDTSAGQGLLQSIGGGLIGLDGQKFRYNIRSSLLNSGFLAYRSEASKSAGITALQHMAK
ncbi:3'(2'),5'-bisphosphate nucleotidase CysQ [Acinetobacter sp. MD2]|uniref:3'(2'),5'-bisphosphate nucleotidase CysQ family protein n=1 Tax=Acinetobacter sp. MD2 TaxID=2600066 RepID=UPI002D1E85BA|nr:3'(2'),5'-bisphosphate nucleotidase CysQ [Acinetobacter sp. MD2]MEB3766505.1 3'(2'),5'-bisphosphate nucleotidase CysQ [Acinetobacter sp. MD2]